MKQQDGQQTGLVGLPPRPPGNLERLSFAWQTSRDLRGCVYVVLVATVTFCTLAASIFWGPGDALDRAFAIDTASFRTPGMTPWMFAASFLADWRLLLPAWLTGYLLARKHILRLGDLMTLMAVLAGSWFLDMGLKGWFVRARPSVPEPLIFESSYSFPSGHSITAFCFYGFVAYLAWVRLPDWPHRVLVSLIFAFVFLVVGFSRVYLGAHYPGDVLGGYLAGLPVLALGIVVHRFLYRPATGFHGGKKV